MSKYAKLDGLILARLAEFPGLDFSQLNTREIAAESRVAQFEAHNQFRVVDRRLQALRKSGLVRFGKGKDYGWRLA